jgi:hypothetical protein
MRKPSFMGIVLLGALTMGVTTQAQQAQPLQEFHLSSADLAVTYTIERAKIAPSDCGCFWLQGGSADAAVTFFHGLGMAANLTGDHASNIAPGVDISKVSLMGGPRYTFNISRWADSHLDFKHGTSFFGEWLFGGVYAFNGLFPATAGFRSSASSFAMQVGGGLDVGLGKGFGLRAFELDYVRSYLSNNGTDTQNHLHLAFGVSYRVPMR